MLVSFKRIIRFGWEKFIRDGSSTGAAIIVLLIVVILASTLLFMQGFTSYVVSSIENRIAISAYFKDSTSEQSILQAKNTILQYPNVQQVAYISKADALAKFKAQHANDSSVLASLQAVGTNPLLASLSIEAKDPTFYNAIAKKIQQSPFNSKIQTLDYQNRAYIINHMTKLSAGIQDGVGGVSIALALIAILIAYNTVRLTIYNSREEIEIMRLVGASNWFIQGPFLAQGVISGLVATLIALVIITPVAFFGSGMLESLAPGFNLWLYYLEHFWILLGMQLLIGVGLGVVSSSIAIRRYLSV